MDGFDRRKFLKGVGAATGVVLARPIFPQMAWASHSGLDAAPFEYGVASGDPTTSSVVIWTRVTSDQSSVSVDWEVSRNHNFTTLVTSGTASALASADHTVHVDVTGLDPGKTYWYRFSALGATSVTGKTRTARANPDHLRFALTSCQDFQAGYYHAWEHIADRDLDFVLFLGDYIYEYADDADGFRPHVPANEVLTLSDYRTRYRAYRADPHLRAAHRRHPFIAVWDDHEVANDRWAVPAPGGAENHNPGEGDYADRLAAAQQAYFEWMPLRRPDPSGEPNRIYRSFAFGDLADLFMLDTRSYRHEPKGAFFNPVENFNPDIADPSRTILGATQKQWLKDGLAGSGARWKLVGNQVMISHLNFASLPDEVAQPLSVLTGRNRDGIPVNYDQWDGYQPERREVLEFIRNPNGAVGATERLLGHPDRIEDVVFLTGDIHTSWANECYVNPGNVGLEVPVATEFVGPSITSINLNELVGDTAGTPRLPHRSSAPVEAVAIAANRHVRYTELDSNGYVYVEVDADRVQADYYYVVNPLGTLGDPVTPTRNPDADVVRPANGSWQVRSGSSRILPVV